MRLEDGRIEDVASGEDRGASIRVVKGATTSFGYADALDEASLFDLADRLAGSLDGIRRHTPVTDARRRPSGPRRPGRLRRRRRRGEGGRPACGRPGRARALGRGAAGDLRVLRGAAAGVDRELARHLRGRRPLAGSPVADGGGAARDGHPDGARDVGASRRLRVDRRRRHPAVRSRDGRQGRRHAGCTAVAGGADAGGPGERVRWRTLSRGLRARARSRLHPQEDQHLGGQVGPAGGGALRLGLRRRCGRRHVGQRGLRRRGHACHRRRRWSRTAS